MGNNPNIMYLEGFAKGAKCAVVKYVDPAATVPDHDHLALIIDGKFVGYWHVGLGEITQNFWSLTPSLNELGNIDIKEAMKATAPKPKEPEIDFSKSRIVVKVVRVLKDGRRVSQFCNPDNIINPSCKNMLEYKPGIVTVAPKGSAGIITYRDQASVNPSNTYTDDLPAGEYATVEIWEAVGYDPMPAFGSFPAFKAVALTRLLDTKHKREGLGGWVKDVCQYPGA